MTGPDICGHVKADDGSMPDSPVTNGSEAMELDVFAAGRFKGDFKRLCLPTAYGLCST